MTRVKIFNTRLHDELEEKINNYIEKGIKHVIDIKFTEVPETPEYNGGYTAMVIYD